ncbi:MAG: hypothetical protein N3G21_04305 [Candidatus Hydrogenedentes bacterium]|nr:hypothetical protein [Candidatus Hydrogenedentota bacterium]
MRAVDSYHSLKNNFRLRELILPVIVFGLFSVISNTYAQSIIQINTIQELQKIGNDPAYPLSGNYELTQNIDASVTLGWNSGAGFAPIGSVSNPFTGKFDGKGYKISNLHINRGGQGYTGLFSCVGSTGEVKNLGIEGNSVNGGNRSGGLVGLNAGLVFRCYSKSSVSGPARIGGLVGVNNGTISQSFSTGNVTGSSVLGGLVGENNGTIYQSYALGPTNGSSQRIGGLVGANYGTIIECFSAGYVTGANNTGGLVGYSSGGVVTDSYWDIETSGRTTSAGGVGLTSAEMKFQITFSNWDFTNVWTINEGSTYPYLIWETYSPSEGEGNTEGTIEGEGTQEGIIEGEGSLEGVQEGEGLSEGTLEGEGTAEGGSEGTTEGSYEGEGLTEGVSEGVTEGEGANEGISEGEGYTEGSLEGEGLGEGTLEGEGNVIFIGSIEDIQKIGNDPMFPIDGNYVLTQDIDASVTIDWNGGSGFIPLGSPGNPFTGTFNGNGHIIYNLFIDDTSGNPAGLFSVIGEQGQVLNLGLQNAQVSGTNGVGGISGANYGLISQCFVTGTSAGINSVGGLVGENYGTIEDCYSSVDSFGSYDVGSLVGYNEGNVLRSYSTGTASGLDNVGGLIGGANGGNVVSSYWDIDTSGLNTSAGGEGKTTEEMQQQSTFIGWDFENVWGIDNGIGYPFLLWEKSQSSEGEGINEGLLEGFFEGEGSTEGGSEGEGNLEGATEGEGSSGGEGATEGTIEGEGSSGGEGITEGTTEGEGSQEGAIEGGAEGEGATEGEGFAEGGVEGEINPLEIHTADINADKIISLTELLRVIQFFNVGKIHCFQGTEDGYAPGDGEDKSCRPHSSDYSPNNWSISLYELLRLIQFFNSGGYHFCGDSEDTFCPGRII